MCFTITLPLQACGPVDGEPKGVVLREEHAKSRAAIESDELITVRLRGQPSTGYTWMLQEHDPSVLEVVGRELVPDGLVGGVDEEVIRFKGVRAGKTRVVLAYRRPWEPAAVSATAASDTTASAVPAFAFDAEVAGPYTGTYEPPAAEPLAAEPLEGSGLLAAPPSYNVCDPGDGSFARCTPIKDQGSCGSCWAFATAGVVENLLAIADPSSTPDLSEQYLVSCNIEGWSCAGGHAAFPYYVDGFRSPPEVAAGAVYETDFPYTAVNTPCGSVPHPHHEKLTTWAWLPYVPTVDAIKDVILQHGAVFVTVCADSAFSWYSSGIHRDTGCRGANHAVILVGWSDNGGDGYWYLRNSWGTWWGENGYMRIAYAANGIGAMTAYAQYSPANRLPVADAGAEQTVKSGATIALDGSASRDPDGAIVAWRWVQTSGTAVALSVSNSARATFTAPAITADTRLTFALTVTDNNGASATSETAVTIVRENRVPVATAGPEQTVSEGAAVTLDGSSSSDPDGSIVAWSWTHTGGPSVSLASSRTAQPTFVAPQLLADSVLTFRLEVTDDSGATASAETQVTVIHANRPPVADAGPAQTVTDGAMVTLDGSRSSDAEGVITAWSWAQTGGPAVMLSEATTPRPTFVVPLVTQDTQLTFRLTVSDAAGARASTSTTVTLHHVNVPPFAHAGAPITASARARVTLDGSRSFDPDGRVQTYRWAQASGPSVAIENATTAWATFTAPPAATTPLVFSLTLTDNAGATATATTSVQVTADNTAPVADAGAEQSVAAGLTVTLDGGRSFDVDGAIVGYYWRQADGPTVSLVNADSAWPTFVASKTAGDAALTFSLTVTDNAGATATATTVVRVRRTNQPPLARVQTVPSIASGASATLDARSSSDPDGSIVSWSWAQTLGPAASLVNSETSTPAFAAPVVTSETTLSFMLTVTDDLGATAEATVDVVVLPASGQPKATSESGGGCGTGAGGHLSLVLALLASVRGITTPRVKS